MKFTYKATKDGKEYENTVDMPDRFLVYKHIRKEGGTVVSVKENELSLSKKMSALNSMFGKVKIAEKIMFTRNLGVMIRVGLSLSRALAILERQTKNKKFKEVISNVGASIKKGSSFHDALAKFPKVFPPLFVSMVKAGEESGGLAEALAVVGKQMEKANTLKKKVKGALIYPSIIVFAMIIIGIVMLLYVVPTLTKTFNELNVELPKSTQFVITISDFLSNNTLVALLLIIILGVGAVIAFKSKRGRRIFEYIILHIPVVSNLVKETNSARTARTLSSLLASGVEVVALSQ